MQKRRRRRRRRRSLHITLSSLFDSKAAMFCFYSLLWFALSSACNHHGRLIWQCKSPTSGNRKLQNQMQNNNINSKQTNKIKTWTDFYSRVGARRGEGCSKRRRMNLPTLVDSCGLLFFFGNQNKKTTGKVLIRLEGQHNRILAIWAWNWQRRKWDIERCNPPPSLPPDDDLFFYSFPSFLSFPSFTSNHGFFRDSVAIVSRASQQRSQRLLSIDIGRQDSHERTNERERK